MKNVLKRTGAIILAVALAAIGPFSYIPLHALHMDIVEAATESKIYLPSSNVADSFNKTLNSQDKTIYIGDTAELIVSSSGGSIENSIEWNTNNSSCVELNVSSNGNYSSKCVVTGKKVGTATISASVSGTGISLGKCTITVNPVLVTGVSVSPSSATVACKSKTTLTAAVTPSNATDSSITWASSDTSVATVSGGTVTGVKAGTATITATANDGSGKSGACTVTVTNPITKIELNNSSKTLYVYTSSTTSSDDDDDTSITLKIKKITYADGSTTTSSSDLPKSSDVSWSTDDDTIARVSSSGIVTAKKKGDATITASYGGVSATCDITVKSKSGSSSSSSSSTSSTSSTTGSTTTGVGRDNMTATALANANSGKTIQANSAAQKNGYTTVSAVANALANSTNRSKLLTSAVEVRAAAVGAQSSNASLLSGSFSSSAADVLASVLTAQQLFDVVTGNTTATVNLVLSETTNLSSAVQTAVEGAKKSGENLYYFESQVVANVGGNQAAVTEFGSSIKIVYNTPTEIKGNSNYRLIQTHTDTAGKLSTAVLEDSDKSNDTYTVSTNKMCTMAFAYTSGSGSSSSSSSSGSSGATGTSSGSSKSSGSKSSSASSSEESATGEKKSGPGMSDLFEAVTDEMANPDVPALMGTIAIENFIIIIEGIIFLTGRRRRAVEFVEKKPTKPVKPVKPAKVSPRAKIFV